MTPNHYCTREQHLKLWELGLRIGAPDVQQLSCAELLDLLPDKIKKDYDLVIVKKNNQYHLAYFVDAPNWSFEYEHGMKDIEDKYSLSLAQLAADRLIWLLEEGIVKPEDLKR
jgi:hypothetical protein